MNPLILEGTYITPEKTETTPEIILNEDENIYSISGRSLPHDAKSFYEPVLIWLDDLSKHPDKDKTIYFKIKLEYYNTSSAKMLLDIFEKLELINNSGRKVVIEWNYADDDEDMLEAGERYSKLVNIKFEMKEYKIPDKKRT